MVFVFSTTYQMPVQLVKANEIPDGPICLRWFALLEMAILRMPRASAEIPGMAMVQRRDLPARLRTILFPANLGGIMCELFEQTSIKGMTLRNRFVRSATWEGMADANGNFTPELEDLYRGLAENEVGLIVTGQSYVLKEGQAVPGQLAIDRAGVVAGLREMTDAVHDKGSKIAMQIAHAGLFSSQALTGSPPMAPSPVTGLSQTPPVEMTHSDIDNLTTAFALASKRAREAGFDAVQLHAAHGFLLNQFLSPAMNKREDRYGGEVENRVAVLVETVAKIREEVPVDYPVLVKLNSADYLQNGLEPADSAKIAKQLEESTVDAIEVSGGTLASGEFIPMRTGILNPEREAYFKKAAEALKQQLSIPVILVGGIRSFGVAEEIVNSGAADYVSLSRPLIREPRLISRWRSGDHRKAACISDNKCLGSTVSGGGFRCAAGT
jgi:2,4-dienoyl-CoA reductase-like NADH-dependent reductase (Old Yellow Enzyme family)